MVAGSGGPNLSVVIPLRDEAGALPRLIDELQDALGEAGSYEIICVDDASVDGTAGALAALVAERPWLKTVRHAAVCGKSAALWTGVLTARAPVVATMDGNGRNDPAAIPRMVAELAEAGPECGLVAAQRLGRHDSAGRRLRSKIGSLLRNAILDDGIRDAACGLKCFPRKVFLELPYFDGLHRFLPALVRQDGYVVSLINVQDRPPWTVGRRSGLFRGIWRAFADIIGVRWLLNRRDHVAVVSAALAATRAGADGAGEMSGDPPRLSA